MGYCGNPVVQTHGGAALMGLFVIARCPRPRVGGDGKKERSFFVLLSGWFAGRPFTVVNLMVVSPIVRALWSKREKNVSFVMVKKRKECFYCLFYGLTSC
jgi:hypothetical protein